MKENGSSSSPANLVVVDREAAKAIKSNDVRVRLEDRKAA
jgi:hypothetical protein